MKIISSGNTSNPLGKVDFQTAFFSKGPCELFSEAATAFRCGKSQIKTQIKLTIATTTKAMMS